MGSKAWQLGAPNTLVYRFYDRLRERLNRKLVKFLLEKGVKGDNCKILEAGSGPGFASSIFNTEDRVCLSIAVDIDPEALHEARRRDPGLATVVADVQHLPFRNESIDLCWNSSTIEHLDTPERALDQMKLVTRSSGTVFVGVPNSYGPLGFQRLISNTNVGIWIGRTFNRKQLIKLLSDTGLQPTDHLFYFFRFFVGILARKGRD
jgi:SAM-dependent methyltransferase